MTNQSKILITLAVFAVIGIGYSVSTSPTTTVAVTTNTEATEVATAPNENMAAEDDIATLDATDITQVDGSYVAYDPAAVSASGAEHIILNFSATWCPSCRALDRDITENLTAIPDGVEIYKVDYDTNVALRQQYGVTTQHTLVIIDAEGNMINKWSGGNTLDSVLAKL